MAIDKATGQVKRYILDEDGEQRDVELDEEAFLSLLRGGDDGKAVVANRTGPDPRRLPG